VKFSLVKSNTGVSHFRSSSTSVTTSIPFGTNSTGVISSIGSVVDQPIHSVVSIVQVSATIGSSLNSVHNHSVLTGDCVAHTSDSRGVIISSSSFHVIGLIAIIFY